MEHPQHCTYALYSLKDQDFYIGSSSDFDRRISEHELNSTGVKVSENNLF